MTRRVFVTGGCGFVGHHLVRRLHGLGHTVTVYDSCERGGAGAIPEAVEVVKADIRDQARLTTALHAAAPQLVVHLAAMHYIPDCDADPARCVDVNVVGTVALLRAIGETSTRPRLVVASTAAVYAPSSGALSEDAPLAPVDVYGLSKLWAEQATALAVNSHGLDGRVARLFNVFGSGETNPHLIPGILSQLRTGRVLRLGNLSTSRDYIHTDDVVAGLLALADAPGAKGEVLTWNLGAGVAVDGATVVREIASALGVAPELHTDNSRLRPVDRPVLLSDVTRARGGGFVPRVSFRDGIRRLIADDRT